MPDAATSEYVDAELMPTLKPALVALCKARPADPVTWLANWLIENKPPPPAFSVTEAFKAAAVKVFNLADADGSGALEFGELINIASHQGEAMAILETMDANKDGVISEEEWVSFFMMLFEKMRPIAEMLLEKSAYMIFTRSFINTCAELFDTFDADKSGVLEVNEILVAIGDDEQGKAFLDFCDMDGDKVLSKDEWMTFFFNFWQVAPAVARANVAFLMQRVEELRTMPAMPPPPPAE